MSTTLPRLRSFPEAFDIYFGQNQFIVSVYALPTFLRSRTGEYSQDGVLVASVIRDIVVAIDISHDDVMEHGPLFAKNLRCLLDISYNTDMRVDLIGDGPLDPVDWAAQVTLRHIAPVVRDLIRKFSDRFAIRRVRLGGESKDISSYWGNPLANAKLAFYAGEPTTTELIQVQIAQWTTRPR